MACQSDHPADRHQKLVENEKKNAPYLVILGIAQDAGYPQAGCSKSCCAMVKSNPTLKKNVTSLALIDPETNKRWLFEATPDFKTQLSLLDSLTTHVGDAYPFDGIFLTHAHIGHYAGLINLGREAMGTQNVSVFAMHRMADFLKTNGPWSQLISLGNIAINPLIEDNVVQLSPNLKVVPFTVPHRDEYSETVGYKITGPKKQIIFIPDIDKWEKWSTSILTLIDENDMLFIDGTFYANGELPGRNMDLIPHPFVEESMVLFEPLSFEDKQKIHFIHFNHTNPLLHSESKEYKYVTDAGYNIAQELQIISL